MSKYKAASEHNYIAVFALASIGQAVLEVFAEVAEFGERTGRRHVQTVSL
jgi:hypothetical protein